MNGNIPEKLKLFVCDPIKITVTYDDSDIKIGNSFMASETFVSDAENAKTCATGESWAERAKTRWNPTTRTYDEGSFRTEDVDNVPIKDVVITSLEHRGQGGRAYKVIVNQRYYVDLREDVLLDAILNVGISAGGKLNGEYIFAKVGSQMKLIRCESALHNELIKAMMIKQSAKLKNLKIGRVYKNKTTAMVYLGKVSTTKLELIEDTNANNSYSPYYARQTKTIKGIKQTPMEGMIFYEFYSFQDDHTKIDFTNDYRFVIRKTHSIKVDTGLDVQIPDNWLETLQKHALKNAMIEQLRRCNNNYSKYHAVDYLVEKSELLNINGINHIFNQVLTP